VESGKAVISFCTIANNRAGDGVLFGWGGGMAVSAPQGHIDVHNCIFWGNTAFEGDQIYPPNLTGVHYCDVEGGYVGEGNFDADPLFATSDAGELDTGYFLSSIAAGQNVDSPCIDASDRTAEAANLDTRTTRTDLFPDTGIADLGFHHRIGPAAAIAEIVQQVPMRIVGSPNPFREQTTIRSIGDPRLGGDLVIYDPSGRRVRLLTRQGTGSAPFLWDGRDTAGRRVAPGVYLMQLRSSEPIQQPTGKIILMP
jgi:hypothetical protein